MSDQRPNVESVRLDDETRAAVLKSLADLFAAHAEHPWHQVGRCVYCGPCGTRLYQGTVPEDHPRWTPPKRKTEADAMRERWGK